MQENEQIKFKKKKSLQRDIQKEHLSVLLKEYYKLI